VQKGKALKREVNRMAIKTACADIAMRNYDKVGFRRTFAKFSNTSHDCSILLSGSLVLGWTSSE
jgi:hypothetical protein